MSVLNLTPSHHGTVLSYLTTGGETPDADGRCEYINSRVQLTMRDPPA
jgi:hypothetical protein